MINIEIIVKKEEKEIREYLNKYNKILIQHTLEWQNIIKKQKTDEDCCLIAKDKNKIVGIFPLFLYKNPLGNILQSNPYPGGYGGILTDYQDKEIIFKKFSEYALKIAKKNNCLTLTICTPPFEDKENLILYRKYFKPDFEKENFYQYIDLKNQLLNNTGSHFRNNLRRNLRKAEKENLQVFFKDNERIFNQWYDIYKKRAKEINAELIPYNFLSSIRENLIETNNYWLITAFKDKRQICGALYVGRGKVIDIFLLMMDSNYKNCQGNTLVIWESLKYFKRLGFEYFNWQSCSSRNSSVYHYKKGWGSEEGIHFYLTKVIGNLNQIKKHPLDEIKEAYKWHYLLPYSEFKS